MGLRLFKYPSIDVISTPLKMSIISVWKVARLVSPNLAFNRLRSGILVPWYQIAIEGIVCTPDRQSCPPLLVQNDEITSPSGVLKKPALHMKDSSHWHLAWNLPQWNIKISVLKPKHSHWPNYLHSNSLHIPWQPASILEIADTHSHICNFTTRTILHNFQCDMGRNDPGHKCTCLNPPQLPTNT